MMKRICGDYRGGDIKLFELLGGFGDETSADFVSFAGKKWGQG